MAKGEPEKQKTKNKTSAKKKSNDIIYIWSGKTRNNKPAKGEIITTSLNNAKNLLLKQGIKIKKITKKKVTNRRITSKDISILTRQLATMIKSGVPILQAIDIIGKGQINQKAAELLFDIKNKVENGISMSSAFRTHPLYFNELFCNLLEAGEQAGILESVLERLAIYQEKTLALKAKIKKALFYPISIIIVAFIITAVVMIFVIPSFKTTFESFGAELPAPTQIVIGLSDIFINWWYIIFGTIGVSIFAIQRMWQTNEKFKHKVERQILKLPVFGDLLQKAAIARWTRTLSTMFGAGVSLVDSFESVAGASGNIVYYEATKQIQKEVNEGGRLVDAMVNSDVFPTMTTQMVAIGEEAGSLDAMLGKVADFYEEEVDNTVDSLSSLMEPMIMVVLGTLIGGMVVALYLPIFKMGMIAG